MKVTTLRLPEDLVDALDNEYAEYGHANRSEYVRWLLERRDRIHENTGNTQTSLSYSERDTENTLMDRIDALEARVDGVEQRLDTTDDGEPSPAPRERADDEKSGSHEETAPTRESAHEPPESDAEPIDPLIVSIVDDVSARWDDDDRLQPRREAARAALELMRDRGSLGRADAVEALLPEYGVEGQNERTWWRQNIRDAVAEVGSYSRGRSAYVWDAPER